MQTGRLLFVFTAVVAVISSLPAAADIPPPDGYVESCTIAKQQPAGSECLECKGDYVGKDRCSTLLGSYCYSWRCKTYGASAWTEILCRSSLGNTPVVPPEVLDELTLYPSQLRLTGGSKAPFGPCGIVDAGVRPEVSLPTSPEAGITPVNVDAPPAVDLSVARPEVGLPATVPDAAAADLPLPWSVADVPMASNEPEVGVGVASDTRATEPTGTSTQTLTSPEPKQESSGCHVAAGTAAVRTFGPLTLILAVLTLVFRNRRVRRRKRPEP